ncbi:MAG TPA: hypothetical protein VMS56_11010 [Thermoanaerobaculia bacterium]|nr:hypothetical protein [Thermoanaerobaculia bacterium]
MTIGALALLAAVSMPVHVTPAVPTVGDPIAIEFPRVPEGSVRLAESDAYELVEAAGNRAVIRSFRPGPLEVRGELVGDGRRFVFRSLEIEIRSVLDEDDTMEPAPLRPPRELPPNRAAWLALAVAVLGAALAWWMLFRAPATAPPAPLLEAGPAIPAGEELLRAIDRARSLERAEAMLLLGAAARRFLSRVEPAWSLDLSSRELRRALADAGVPAAEQETIETILMEADLEKFSPWGAPEIDRDALLAKARLLAELDRREDA